MSDSFTETTTKSWTSRIGESIKGVLFGLALVVGSCVFLFWNEGRAVQTARSLTEGASIIVAADPARVDPANEGKLVHLSGDIKVAAPLVDPDFTVSATAIRLVRTVEMYQWKEERRTETRRTSGGGEETITTYEYVRTWSDHRINSSGFRQREGHANPEMRYSGRALIAGDATLGAYRPGNNVLQRLPAEQVVPLDPALAEKLRGHIGGRVHVADGRIFLGENPSRPLIGDLRISFKIAPPGPASIIGRQAGADFSDYQTEAGDRLLLVRAGTHSAADMFSAAQWENRILTWMLRLAGVLAMAFGFFLILNPLVVVADIVPFLGGVLSAGAGIVSLLLTAIIAPLVIAIAWFWYRPLVSAIVLAIGLAAAYGFRQWASRKAATRATVRPATT
ncbi:MAG: TMEM43 family protein [Xanthobacteraceae bacterium]